MPEESEPSGSFRAERAQRADGTSALALSGVLDLASGGRLWAELQRLTSDVASGSTLDIDLSEVESADGGAVALIVQQCAELEQRGVTSEIVGASGSVETILELYEEDLHTPSAEAPRAPGFLEQVGLATIGFFREAKLILGFLGTMVLSTMDVVRRPRTANWRDTLPIMERSGADALPIVCLINFLIGFVMAFQGAAQLKQFGANIFVADLVGLAVTRELAPLMTAIIVCGRSGAAFAAELGTMKVSEEIDALRTMGFGPFRFLVMPRVWALMLALPILTIVADLVGIVGGLVVGLMSLDLTVVGYGIETRTAVTGWDVLQGLIKSLVFAFAIGIISCQQGLATTGGAEGVGRRTTSSVVATLFTLILIDAAFTVLFHALHW